MTTQYQNQSVQYSDTIGNTATLTPNIGLVLSNGVTNLTMDQTGFTNGVQSLLFSDLYAGVQKTESIKYLASTSTKLSVVDTIEVLDAYPLFNNLTTITPTDITITDNGGNQTSITAVSLSLTDGTTTNTLDHNSWSGNIQTVNTSANSTHFLNFSDSSATGYGKPQKTAGLSVNPSTNTITATNFNGTASSSSTAVGVNLTSDNTAGTYYIPFSKTITATGNSLFIDNVTGPLTYNPSTSTMNCLYFSGDEIRPTTQNTATFAGSTLSVSGASNGQNVSSRNSSIVISGGSGNINALTLTNMVVNGTYKVGILNSSGSNLTINTGLGTNIRTIYSGSFNVSSGRYALMTIDVIVINGTTQYIVNATQLTN
jgi:hypothetical protein